MYQELEAVLDRYVRPLLAGHGGGMEVVDVENGEVRFKLTGLCAGCPTAYLTTEELIRSELTARVPGVTGAVLVQQVSDDLLAQAKAILRKRHA